VIKGAFPQLRVEPMFGEDLDERGARASRHAAARRTTTCAGAVQLSQAPVWDRAHAAARAPIGLRVFACASPNGYVVMPGGLDRVAAGTMRA
jgi:uncharacterized circularly permuted ATP-grasp superfamily protein